MVARSRGVRHDVNGPRRVELGRRPSRSCLTPRERRVRSCRRGRGWGRGCRRPLPTWPGRPRPGGVRTYWAALILRTSSAALRPTPSDVISMSWITPSGSTTNVARSARPAPGRMTSKLFVIAPGGVAEHRVLDLADRVGRAVPRLVREVGVGRHRVHLDAEALQILVVVGEVAELGRADEREVGRVEEEDRPLAAQVVAGDVDELAGAEAGCGEGLDLGVHERHGGSSVRWWLVDGGDGTDPTSIRTTDDHRSLR